MKDIYLLGASGSIGTQTLDVCREHKFKIKGMSLGRDLSLSLKIIEEFKPEIVCLRTDEKINLSYSPKIVFGDEGLLEVASYGDGGILINALVGSVGLKPTIEAIKNHKDIALANKETLVMAGDIIMPLIKEYNVLLHPIDSEHSAIWQCLNGESHDDVKKIIITASGGAFRDKSLSELKDVTVSDALKHPNWQMGPKITIDSATMMNKGFEVIEAHHLFNMPFNQIETIMHKESVIHSLVMFNDLSVKAVLGNPDMRIPILYALTYPKHVNYNSEEFSLLKYNHMTFNELSMARYKCLRLAYYAGNKGGLYPTVLNAVNEALVYLFIDGKIKFLDIENIVEVYLNKEYKTKNVTIDEIITLDKNLKQEIKRIYGGI